MDLSEPKNFIKYEVRLTTIRWLKLSPITARGPHLSYKDLSFKHVRIPRFSDKEALLYGFLHVSSYSVFIGSKQFSSLQFLSLTSLKNAFISFKLSLQDGRIIYQIYASIKQFFTVTGLADPALHVLK